MQLPLTNASTERSIGSCLGGDRYGFYGHFVNCTFEENVSYGNSARYTFGASWGSTPYMGIVNCVFNNNRCGYTSGGTFVRNPEFRDPGHNNEGYRVSYVNTVFANDDADYMPFADNEKLSWPYLSFANCVSSSSVGWGTATSGTFRYQPLVSSEVAPLKDFTETNGTVVARGIATSSPYRKMGIPVYRDKYGDLFIYDTVYDKAKPWRLLSYRDTVYSDADGAARGLSRSSPIPDAFDRGRHKLRTTLGPLDYHAGAVLRLR